MREIVSVIGVGLGCGSIIAALALALGRAFYTPPIAAQRAEWFLADIITREDQRGLPRLEADCD